MRWREMDFKTQRCSAARPRSIYDFGFLISDWMRGSRAKGRIRNQQFSPSVALAKCEGVKRLHYRDTEEMQGDGYVEAAFVFPDNRNFDSDSVSLLRCH